MFPQGNVCIRVPEMTHSNMTSGEGVGWIGRCKWLPWNGLAMRSCCVALGTLPSHWWWSMLLWENRVCTCMRTWVTMLCSRKKKLYWGNKNSKPNKKPLTHTTSELYVRLLQLIAWMAEEGEEATRTPALLECLGTMVASAIFSYEGLVWKPLTCFFIIKAQIQSNTPKVFIFAMPHQGFLDTKLTMALHEILSPQLPTLFWVHFPLQGARSFWSTHTSLFLKVEQSFQPLLPCPTP